MGVVEIRGVELQESRSVDIAGEWSGGDIVVVG